MESRFQRGDLHPSHKIAPGMVRNLNVIRTPLVFAPLEYVRKRGATAHFIGPREGSNGNVGCSRTLYNLHPGSHENKKVIDYDILYIWKMQFISGGPIKGLQMEIYEKKKTCGSHSSASRASPISKRSK